MFTPEGGLPHQGTPTTVCLSPWHSTSEQTTARGRQQLMSNNTTAVIQAEGYQKIVNLLGSVNEPQSCQNYLATRTVQMIMILKWQDILLKRLYQLLTIT